jgi:hypothetical protein
MEGWREIGTSDSKLEITSLNSHFPHLKTQHKELKRKSGAEAPQCALKNQ